MFNIIPILFECIVKAKQKEIADVLIIYSKLLI